MSRYVIYCRKSTESEDRQVLSIESQTRELLKLAEKLNLDVIDVVSEARSAKHPGRKLFNSLVSRIHSGEVGGIVCWKLDRLARNALDGGTLIHAMSAQGLHIVTPSQTYHREDDNLLLMYLEFGVAQKYVDDLSKNVKRGLKTKAQNGWYPQPPPPGYKTEKTSAGERIVIRDPDLFEPVKALWNAVLNERMSVEAARQYVGRKWQFKPSKRRQMKSGMLSRSTVYRILNSRFYTGRFEYPLGSGVFYEGKHDPMISEQEFHVAQQLLKSGGKQKGGVRCEFPYRGLITCGECKTTITYEEKHRIICDRCRKKFSVRHREECPKCSKSVKSMRRAMRRVYKYCHCSGRGRLGCSQPSITLEELESQFVDFIGSVEFCDEFVEWLSRNEDNFYEDSKTSEEKRRENIEKGIADVEGALTNLLNLFASPGNSDQSLIARDEYEAQRSSLLTEKKKLGDSLAAFSDSTVSHICLPDETAKFGARAAARFQESTSAAKLATIHAMCSKPTLIDGKLRIRAKEHFLTLSKYHQIFKQRKRGVRTQIHGSVEP